MSDSEEDLAAIIQKGASNPAKKIAIIVVVLGLMAGGAYFLVSKKQTEAQGSTYVTRPVEKTDISIIVTASGNLKPTNQVVIGSELSGTVMEVHADTNDTVKKGDPLLRLDTEKLEQQTERSRANLLSAKARVKQSEATLKEAQATLARQEELLELSGGKTPSRAVMESSRAVLARAEADLQSAEASVVASEAEIGAIESDLARALIRSPVDGMVLLRSIEVGQTVAASFNSPTLFTIAEDLRKMEVVVSVAEADIGRVKAGQTATFNVDAWPGRTYTAMVQKVAFGSAALANAGNSGGGGGGGGGGGVVTYDTELSVDNEDLSLRPGMTATVDIAVVDERDIIAVPNEALRFDPEMYKALNEPEDDEDQTLVESLSPGRRFWRGRRDRGAGGKNAEEGVGVVWILRDGEPAKIEVRTGITDGRITQIVDDSLEPGMELVTSIEPTKG